MTEALCISLFQGMRPWLRVIFFLAKRSSEFWLCKSALGQYERLSLTRVCLLMSNFNSKFRMVSTHFLLLLTALVITFILLLLQSSLNDLSLLLEKQLV
jgi:hypothetical protein